MAHPDLGATLALFDATIHRTKNRLISVPAGVQRQLGLARKPDNDLLLVSVRKVRSGRWNHHYVKLTSDNEFAIPADVTRLSPGDEVEVKVHGVFSGVPKARARPPAAAGAALLVELATRERPGWREDGSARVDEYLADEHQ